MACSVIGHTPDSGAGDATPDSAKVTYKYLVLSDNVADDARAACTASGIPTEFSQLAGSPTLRARRASAERVSNLTNAGYYWVVTVDFETPEKNTGDDTDENTDPLSEKPRLSIEYEDREEVVRYSLSSTSRDPNGAIKNVLGEVFDPPPVKTTSTLVITIKQNYISSWDVVTNAVDFMDTINSGSFIGFAAGSARLTRIKPVMKVRNSTEYVEIEYVIKVKQPDWHLRLLNIGTKYYDNLTAQVVKNVVDGVLEPCRLSKPAGTKLADTDADVFLDPIQIYAFADFSLLGLPTTTSGYKLE